MNSVVWRQDEPLALVPGEEVRAGVPYTVDFRWPTVALQWDVDVEGLVQRDASGAIDVELD